jgi:hypothetical protein
MRPISDLLEKIIYSPIFCVDYILGHYSFEVLVFSTKLYFVHISIIRFKRGERVIEK